MEDDKKKQKIQDTWVALGMCFGVIATYVFFIGGIIWFVNPDTPTGKHMCLYSACFLIILMIIAGFSFRYSSTHNEPEKELE